MKNMKIFQSVALCLFFIFPIIACTKNINSNNEKITPQFEKQEFEYIQKRFFEDRNQSIFEAIGWTLQHSANPKQLQNVSKQLESLKILWSNDPSDLDKIGGIKNFKDNIAGLLDSDDGVIRAFGAITLGLIGDQSYSKRIAKLLEDKHKKPSDYLERAFMNYDRSRAAMALGLLGSKTYSKQIRDLLQSRDQFDRMGAALGLGYMNAIEYADAIAKLLNDNEDQVQNAAMESLAVMSAKDYAKHISKLLSDEIGDNVDKTACYALVKLNATEYAEDISSLLEKEFIRGDAAKALALMNASQYIKNISNLLEDNKSIVRKDALIALGVLNAKQYTDKIARHLTDQEEYVRSYAALSLLMMDCKEYRSEVLSLLTDKKTGGANLPLNRSTFHPIVVEKYKRIKERVEKSFYNMKERI